MDYHPKLLRLRKNGATDASGKPGRVRKARAFVTDDMFLEKWFLSNRQRGVFSGFYGSQRILNGKPRSPHYGIDIAGPVGTPIIAPAGGVVRLAAPDFLLEGGIIIIDHGYGVHIHPVFI